ncbi:MAG: hypothetical protein OER80_06935 [Gammaproteobacteria bacterium]|nr:hypothetical protein [Gammaproteobacteria bacterium]MDH3767644.1 hypothetical protein [Gammaproteobacteria bacterium]
MNDTSEIVCWRCGGSLAEISFPLRRLEECPACHAELHVCKMCEFFDPNVAESCREPVAAEVRDKEHANFCDYLRLAPNAYQPASAEQSAAASRLGELFGDDGKDATHDDPTDELEDLFKKPTN